ncbi:MAG TPA: T9SS type A sorting domain-containing protein [Bacteroidota bacterium]|nr:T9SS type A sorting domain-containing protein [Bacteroidota bacterium]
MEKRILRCLLLAVLLNQVAPAQTAYHIPFASQGNMLELVVVNASSVEATEVNVRIQSAPAWLRFAQTEQKISAIAAGEEQRAVFVFAVEKSAPVGEEHRLQFRISMGDGQNWTKEIPILVSAPERFELFQNYPNPFNPTTTIAYQLPVAAHVSLRIFNLLGQEVATLVDGEQLPGYHQQHWNAGAIASGLYVYQLSAKDRENKLTISRRAMVFVK